MAVPLVGRSLAAAAGGLLVLTAWASVIGTLMVPRAITSWLTRWTDLAVNGTFRLVTGHIDDHKLRDRVLDEPSLNTRANLREEMVALIQNYRDRTLSED